MPVAEEGVRVGDAFVRAARDSQHRLASPDVREREGQAVHHDPVAALDEALGLLGIAIGVGPPRQPPAVVAPLGRAQSRIRVHVVGAHLLAAPERLEHRAPGNSSGR